MDPWSSQPKIHHRGRKDDISTRNMFELLKKTHFNKEEQIIALTKIFSKLSTNGRLDRVRFRDFVYSSFGLVDDIVLDRMYSIFSEDALGVNETNFLNCVSILTRGSLEEKIAYVYRIYDISGTNAITREVISHFLRNCMAFASYGYNTTLEAEEAAEAVKDISEQVFKKLDVDKNGVISEDDFTSACMADPILLESLSHCIPSNSHIKAFLILFCDNYSSFESNLSNFNDQNYDSARHRGKPDPGVAARHSLTFDSYLYNLDKSRRGGGGGGGGASTMSMKNYRNSAKSNSKTSMPDQSRRVRKSTKSSGSSNSSGLI